MTKVLYKVHVERQTPVLGVYFVPNLKTLHEKSYLLQAIVYNWDNQYYLSIMKKWSAFKSVRAKEKSQD